MGKGGSIGFLLARAVGMQWPASVVVWCFHQGWSFEADCRRKFGRMFELLAVADALPKRHSCPILSRRRDPWLTNRGAPLLALHAGSSWLTACALQVHSLH